MSATNENTTAAASLADLTRNLNEHAEHGTCACGGQPGACACGGHDHRHTPSQFGIAPSHGTTVNASPRAADSAASTDSDGSISAEYAVDGMTCGNCVRHVSEAFKSLPGVRSVTTDLVAGGTSTVRVASDAPLDDATVREALDEAGYTLHG